jgi:hypothetical protein
MTPVQKELFKQSGRAKWAKAVKATISWATIFAVVGAWTLTLQLVGYAQHRDRVDLYERCLDQQLKLIRDRPALLVVPECRP